LAQSRIKSEASRFNVIACGRRFGKTLLCLDLNLEVALDGQPVGWFAPSYKILSEAWRDINRLAGPIISHASVQEKRLEFITGGVWEFWSLDQPDAGRSRKYKRVVIDEAAMVSNFQQAWEDSIRPTLSDLKGDAFFPSTPKGLNYFFTLYQRGQDSSYHDWKSWQMPTAENPYIDKAEIEAAHQELPSLTFSQEYLAQFIQTEGAVFRNIDECLTAGPTTPEDHSGHEIVIGVDWGQKHDFTCVSVGCGTCKTELALDRFNKIEWEFQRGRILTIAKHWNITGGLVELNSIGGPNFEALQREGLPVNGFEMTGASKGPLIQSFALALERKEIQLLPDAVGKHELLAYESRVNQITHRISYSAPEGGHDDTVIARALMWKVINSTWVIL